MFKKKPHLITKRTKFPTGTVVHSPNGYFFIKGSVALRIANKSILDSWRFPRIVEVEQSSIKDFPVAGKLGYRDGTALKAYGSRKIYLVSGQKVRHVTDPETLMKLGIFSEDIVVVADEEIFIHKEGEPLGSI